MRLFQQPHNSQFFKVKVENGDKIGECPYFTIYDTLKNFYVENTYHLGGNS